MLRNIRNGRKSARRTNRHAALSACAGYGGITDASILISSQAQRRDTNESIHNRGEDGQIFEALAAF